MEALFISAGVVVAIILLARIFLGEKITGDPNVPYGKLTSKGSLDDAIQLTAEDQETMATLAEAANNPVRYFQSPYHAMCFTDVT